MSTPFEFFRRNQKVALAAITGMSILSFLVIDAGSSNGQISGVASAVLLIGCLAIVGWIVGVKDHKSRENAIFGAVLGLAVSLLFMFFGRQASSTPAKSGAISQQTLNELARQRNVANRMVSLVFQNANPTNAGQRGPSLFGYLGDDDNEWIVTQLLLREADTFGIRVDREAALRYLKEVAGDDENGDTRLTKQVYEKSLSQTLESGERISEATVLRSIQEELRARAASLALYGSIHLTPQDYWDLHRKMAVRQSSHFVSIPLEEFIDKKTEPTDAEFKELFAAHRENYPNFTAKGDSQPGLPGFALQRRVKLAYLEPDYEALEKQVPAITDEEVLERYESTYMKSVPLPQLPLLPNAPNKTEGEAPPPGEAPATETPKAEPAATPEPEAKPETNTDAKPEEKPAPAPEAKPDAPATETPAPTEEAPEAKPADQPQSSVRPRASLLQPVALIADEPAAAEESAPAPEKPAAPDAPAAEPPAPETPPATEKPAEPAKTETPAAETGSTPPAPPENAPLTVPATEAPDADSDPAPPVSSVRPLDEALKQELRDELLRERTDPLKRAKIQAARDYMAELGDRVQEYLDHQKAVEKSEAPLTEKSLSPEAATKLLKEYAAKNGYLYADTPLLSYGDLLRSEDHPVGMAQVGAQMSVVDASFRSTSDLYVALAANSFISGAHFASWKLEDVAAHHPETLDEPGVRDMVVKAWQMNKARPLAEKRAAELAEIIRKSDKPMSEALADQTVNGQPATLFVTVKATGDYQWVSMDMGGFSPRLGSIPGIEPQEIDDPFRAKIFETMQPGDVDVVPNADRSVLYVMQVDTRSHTTEAEMEALRKNLIGSNNTMQVFILQMTLSQAERNTQFQQFVKRLEERHGVELTR